MHKRATRRSLLLLTAALGTPALVASTSCQSEEPETCVSNEDFFQEEIWAPVMSQTCINCHNPTGVAKDSKFVLQTSDWPGYIEANLATVEKLAKLEYEGEPWLLVKPTNTLEHGGGEQFPRGGDTYDKFAELVERIKNPVACAEQEEGDYWDDIEMLDDVQTLRKASLSLVGRFPTPDEEQRVADGPEDGSALDDVLGKMMKEDAFYDRLVEVYNDNFLTDRYLPDIDALALLDGEDYEDLFWFDDIENEQEMNLAERRSNEAVAREAVQLIAHVVREDRPFTEILTADYMVVNPYSARSYGLNVSFDDDDDPNEWREATLPGVPHAGVLTSHIFMNRFPTTPTNRNRHRARMVFKFFLATDILALAERPIDPANIQEFNPTRESAACTVCHANLDPMAGTLQNWDEFGRYRPPEDGWYPEMFKPGFGDAELPGGDYQEGAQWLATQISSDNRFATSIVQTMWKGLSGQDALREPGDAAATDYLGKLRAFEEQSEDFKEIAAVFIESEYDLKVLVKELVRSPWYRATRYMGSEELEEERFNELLPVVTARYLTPEMLNRKVEAVTGYPWRDDPGDEDYLTDLDEYRIFYGGIDSDTVNERITDPNGIMSNIAERMSNEVACWNSARDFVEPAATRHLFPFVEPGYEPEDDNGFEIPASSQAIRANIVYLHERLLGEFLDPNDPEIDRSYALFLEVWRDGKKGLKEGSYETQLPGECRATHEFWSGADLGDQAIENDNTYTIRAWMAVLSYLLADYRFLHE